jgi:hypothetical protein
MRLKGLILTGLALCLAVRAEEGLWTFDNIPVARLKAKYGFAPDQQWLDHLRLSSLHWGGASGSFISPDGLALTNHHVGRGSIARVSTKDKDYLKTGFVARTREEEIKIPGLSIRTLMQMENVTDKVNAAVKPGMKDGDAVKAREKALTDLKDANSKKWSLSCDGVTFYEGGEYWVYGYKVHTDVRLVAAPEIQLAMFGGDFDNFTYPRHELDFSLFRVYENDKPYKPTHFLKWSQEGVKNNELTFVSGHPGRTSRAWTHAQMMFQRDFAAPIAIKNQERQRATLLDYSAKSEENARAVTTRLLGLENSLKAAKGYYNGLVDKAAMDRIKKAEDELRAKVAKDPALQASAGQSWTKITQALKGRQGWYKDATFVDGTGIAPLGQALNLLRFVEESAKPAEKRAPEYNTPEKLTALRRRLEGGGGGQRGAAAEPNPALDTLLVAATLKLAKEELPATHPFLLAALNGKSPEEAAKLLVEGTQLNDAAARKALLDGGAKAIAESRDPVVVLARKLAPLSAKLRKVRDDYTAVMTEQAARIAKARFKVYGKTTFPDANSTLRLGFGPVATYPASGTLVQPFTTFGGLFDRYDGWGGNKANVHGGAWTLPQRWLDAKGSLDLSVPLNFAHSVDTIGGNSGSPIVNTRGEIVGLLFDGNYEGLPSQYFYDEKVNRSVSVDVRGIVEGLTKVMNAPHIVKEILGR